MVILKWPKLHKRLEIGKGCFTAQNIYAPELIGDKKGIFRITCEGSPRTF